MRIQEQEQERRAATETGACVVCGTTDARVLAHTRLESGERIRVCGSHKTAHHRSGAIASSVDELRRLVGERRAS